MFKVLFDGCLLVGSLTLSVLMSYIHGAPCKATIFYVVYIYIYIHDIYMNLCLATLKAVSFYLLHNVSTLNRRRKLSCVTVVCKHFASYQGYPNYR
jgi:glucan phosphoethanolaminetransferase (alkaline phosphatase superfamily)